MHVSVPGMYQNPAPYRLQILTYSTALAFTGRSAACAPPTAIRPAAEPRIRLLTIFMLNLQVVAPYCTKRMKLPPKTTTKSTAPRGVAGLKRSQSGAVQIHNQSITY